MKRFFYDIKRTHRCGSLRNADTDSHVALMGWVQSRRDHGGCVFIDLRDREGITQVVFDPQVNAEAHGLSGELRSEWVVAITGTVRHRGEHANDRLATGAIEIAVDRLEVLSAARTPPFLIEDNIDTAEDVRLKYRFLDLRRPLMQRNLMLRHRFNRIVRESLEPHGFLELETPFLIKSTPEGARDYVVPSRVHPGEFFALPQSPQLFKQLFMIGGFDRYFQIVRCFRDEDLRADRQPEFTQVDIEMSFCAPNDIQTVVEQILVRAWKELLGITIQAPFQRISYDESMRRFGVDAPDMRFGLELIDLSKVVVGCGFKVFASVVEGGGVVQALNLRGAGDLSRKDLDGLTDFVKIYGAKGLAWLKVKEDGSWQSPIAKFFDDTTKAGIDQALDLQAGDIAVFVADTQKVTHAALGNLRKHVAKTCGMIKEGAYRFCWVTDFPAFDWDDDRKRWNATHHPFTAPRPEDCALLGTDPGKVRAEAYDVVLNGIEIGGGSIRIHDAAVQAQVFEALGVGSEEQREKFGFLLDALAYGAPPHGGVALGVDRIMMLINGMSSIRDVIAFPKTQKQADLMLDAPSRLSPDQLTELSLRTVESREPGSS